MKTFNEFIISENENNIELFEHIVSDIYNYIKDKTLNKDVSTMQYIGQTSKNPDVQNFAKKQKEALQQNDLSKMIEITKNQIEKIMGGKMKNDRLYYPLYNVLKTYADKTNNNELKNLADEFKIYMEKEFPDVEQKIVKKVENIEHIITAKKIKKEINNETRETIIDNKELIAPLAEIADVDSKLLQNFVGTQLRKTLKKDQDLIRKKGTRKAVQKALGENVILGTCIMILGALITNDNDKIKIICDQIGSSVEELRNKLKKYK